MRFLALFSLALVLNNQFVSPADLRRDENRHRRSDDASPLAAVVENLSRQVSDNNARITTLEAQLNKAQTSVAFHVEFSGDNIPLGPHAPLIFDRVRTNVGNGYDVLTGSFQAPVSGTYMFVVNYMGAIDTYLYVNMYVDNVNVDYSISHGDGSTWDHVSESLVVQLKAGQKVLLKNGNNAQKEIRGSHWSTFSGFLIQADP